MTGEQKAAAVGSLPISSAFQGIPTYTNQEKVTSAVTDMIIDLNLPVSIVDRQSFRKVLATASCGRWRPVCGKTIRARIIELGSKWSFDYSEYKLKFAKPSTTLDIWTSKKRRGYMAVSIHLQTTNGLDTKVLDLAHIPCPHTAENIKRKYEEILASHGLDASDTFKTVCDNASNMKKAFKVSIWEQDEDEEFLHASEGDEIDDDEEMQDIDVDLETVFQDQYRRPCTIHTLQLLVKDCLQELPSRYRNVLSKAKVVCRKQHQSSRLSEAMAQQLPTPGETRWNAQYRLLLKIEENFEDVKTNIGEFVESDLPIIKSICNFLKMFYTLTKRMESEKLTTVQDIIPLFCKLERDITACQMPAPFINASLDALEKRFHFICTDLHLLSATVLSPHGWKWLNPNHARNIRLKFASEETLKQNIHHFLNKVVEEVSLIIKGGNDVCEPTPKAQKVEHEMFGYDEFETSDDLSAKHWLPEFEQHLMRISSVSPVVDASAYWLEQTRSPLQAAALMILAVPASSAPVERVFSHAGLICSSKRTSMKDDLLSALVKAKYNYIDK